MSLFVVYETSGMGNDHGRGDSTNVSRGTIYLTICRKGTGK